MCSSLSSAGQLYFSIVYVQGHLSLMNICFLHSKPFKPNRQKKKKHQLKYMKKKHTNAHNHEERGTWRDSSHETSKGDTIILAAAISVSFRIALARLAPPAEKKVSHSPSSMIRPGAIKLTSPRTLAPTAPFGWPRSKHFGCDGTLRRICNKQQNRTKQKLSF